MGCEAGPVSWKRPWEQLRWTPRDPGRSELVSWALKNQGHSGRPSAQGQGRALGLRIEFTQTKGLDVIPNCVLITD